MPPIGDGGRTGSDALHELRFENRELLADNEDLVEQLWAAGREAARWRKESRKLSRWLDAIVGRAERSGSNGSERRPRWKRVAVRFRRSESDAELRELVSRIGARYRARPLGQGRSDTRAVGEPYSRGTSRSATRREAAKAYSDYRLAVEWVVDPSPSKEEQASSLAVLLLDASTADERLVETTSASVTEAGAEVIASPDQALAFDWIVIAAAGDAIKPTIAGRLATVPESVAAVVFDDEIVDENGDVLEGRLKPGFQPDLLLELDYVGTAAAFRPSVLQELGVDLGSGPDAVRDLLLRCSDAGLSVQKIDSVLVRSVRSSETRDRSRARSVEFAGRVLARREAALRSSGVAARAEPRGAGALVRYRSTSPPRVSIIIPFRNGVQLLRDCVASILRLTTYPNFEIILVDNQSDLPETRDYLASIDDPRVVILPYDHPFNFSKINNFAAARADGDVLILLNNDTEVLSPEWIDDLVGAVCRPEVGSAGAFLHFPDGSIQHAGVVMGTIGHCDHLFAHAHETFLPHEYVRHTRDCLAVTAACVAVRRDVFEELGGLDERLKVINNDVDLGLKILASGRRNILLPQVRLIHKESATRDHREVDPMDIRLLVDRARLVVPAGDPFYHPGANYPRAHLAPARRLERPVDVDGMIEGFANPGTSPPHLPRLAGAETVTVMDTNREALVASRAVTDGQDLARGRAPGTATWFIRLDTGWGSTEVWTALELADRWGREHGCRHVFAFCGRAVGGRDADFLREMVVRRHSSLSDARFAVIPEPRLAGELPASDIAFAVDWLSTAYLLRFNKVGQKYYLADSRSESMLDHPGFEEARRASFRLSLPVIELAPWMDSGMLYPAEPVLSLGPRIDPALFKPRPGLEQKIPDDPVRIIFGGVPSDSGFALGMSALVQLRNRLGSKVEIASLGKGFTTSKLGVGVVKQVDPIRSEKQLAEIYRSADIALVLDVDEGLSYDLVRAMSIAMPVVVTRAGRSLPAGLVDRFNCLVSEPVLTSLVDALEELVLKCDLRESIGRNALDIAGPHLGDPKVQQARLTGWLTGADR